MISAGKNAPDRRGTDSGEDAEGGGRDPGKTADNELELTQAKLYWTADKVAGAEPDGLEMTSERRERLIAESTPMKLTELFVERPCTMLCGSYCILLALAVLAVMAGFFDLNTEQGREWYVWDDPITKDFEKYTLADTYISKNSGSDVLDVRSVRSGVVLVIYESKAGGKGLLNKGYFQKIESWEAATRANSRWKEVCLADASKDENPPCSDAGHFSPFSTVNKYIRADNGLATGASLTDSLTDAKFEASFRKLMKMGDPTSKKAWLSARGFLDKYVSAENYTLTYAQSYLQPASPLNVGGRRYKNQTDGELEQFNVHKEFAAWLKKDAKENSVDGGYEVAPWSTILLADEFNVIL